MLQALDDERFGQLADNILTVLRYLGSRFESAKVRDPANGKNILSDDISESGRQAIAKAARAALYDENWKKIIW